MNVVENEEFVLRAEQRRVGNSRGLEVGLGALGERARIALVALHGHRLDDVATQADRGLLVERIDHGGRGIGHENHVGLVDALPAGDRRAIKHLAVAEKAGVHEARRDGDVLFLTQRVRKAEIGEFRFFFVDKFNNIGGSHLRPLKVDGYSRSTPGFSGSAVCVPKSCISGSRTCDRRRTLLHQDKAFAPALVPIWCVDGSSRRP